MVCRNELALLQRPIGKPRPQRLCFECIEDGRSLAFLDAPLRTGLSDRSHFQWFRLLGTHFPDEPILNDLSPAACHIAYNYNTPVDVEAVVWVNLGVLRGLETR